MCEERIAARKVVVEVEVPEGVDREEYIREVRGVLRKLYLYTVLERGQRRVPSREEVEELSREARRGVWKRVKGRMG